MKTLLFLAARWESYMLAALLLIAITALSACDVQYQRDCEKDCTASGGVNFNKTVQTDTRHTKFEDKD